MSGKPTTSGLTQQEEIGLLKDDFISYYKELPIKKAGADFIGRSIDTINNWEKDDLEFADRVLKAKAEYARKHGKGRPDNLLPKLYPELASENKLELTVKQDNTLEELLAEAKRQGIDTSPYERLNPGTSDNGTLPQDRPEEGA